MFLRMIHQFLCSHHVTTDYWFFNEWTGEDRIESMCVDCEHITIKRVVRAGHAPPSLPRVKRPMHTFRKP